MVSVACCTFAAFHGEYGRALATACCNIVIYVASKHHESCYIVHMLRHSTIQVARTARAAPKHHKAAPQAACTLQQVIRPLLGHRDAACLLFVDDDASNTDDVAAGAAVARAPECVVCMPCVGAPMHVSHVHARVVLACGLVRAYSGGRVGMNVRTRP